MLEKAIRLLFALFPDLRQSISRRWYDYLSALDTGTSMLFMNYGYTELNHKTDELELEANDEEDRYSIQHYHHVASPMDWLGLEALEVGCGRGGGCSYLKRYLQPKSMIGMDISANAIGFCSRNYSMEGLSFLRGDAEALPFADHAFDVIINLESSHCYANVEIFFREVFRVLKPGGHFLYADFRKSEEIDNWRAQLENAGLELLQGENITPNVARSLDLDHDRKHKLINQYIPRILHRPFNAIAGMKGSRFIYGSFKSGDKIYMSFALRRPAN